MTLKKLLIVTDTFFPRVDGVTVFLEKILPALDAKYDVTIFAPSDKIKKPKKGNYKHIPCVFFPTTNRAKVETYTLPIPDRKLFKEYIKKTDIVFTQSIAPLGITALHYGKRYKKSLIAYTHSIEWQQLSNIFFRSALLKKIMIKIIKLIGKHMYNKVDLLVTPSREIAKYFERLGVKRTKAVVPLGVDVERFSPGNTEKAKAKLGLEGVVIGYAGRLSAEKGLEILLEAYKRLALSAEVPINLLIVGDGSPKIKALFKDVPGVKMSGFVKDVVPYLHAMDIFVLPSFTETSSLATMEAMACGIPVVCTPVGFPKTHVHHKQNGLIVPAGNIERLYGALLQLAKDEQRRTFLGINAKKTIKEFSWEKAQKRFCKVIDSVSVKFD